jgi:hypothetical protein
MADRTDVLGPGAQVRAGDSTWGSSHVGGVGEARRMGEVAREEGGDGREGASLGAWDSLTMTEQ